VCVRGRGEEGRMERKCVGVERHSNVSSLQLAHMNGGPCTHVAP